MQRARRIAANPASRRTYAAQDLMRRPEYNGGEWCWAAEYTTMQQTQLLMFLAALAAWVVCGCIFTRKPKKRYR